MAEVKRLAALQAKLRQLSRTAAERASVSVGFTAAYAVYVHENLEARHPVGQAKFLEEPARELSESGELNRTIAEGHRRGLPLSQSLLTAGLRLQREAQMRCPVDTGALRASAFTRLDGSGQEAGGEGG